jgi:hypothetical protein
MRLRIAAHLLQNLEPAHARHHLVKQYHIDGTLRDDLQSLDAIQGRLHLIAGLAKPTREHIYIHLFVFDDQNADLFIHFYLSSSAADPPHNAFQTGTKDFHKLSEGHTFLKQPPFSAAGKGDEWQGFFLDLPAVELPFRVLPDEEKTIKGKMAICETYRQKKKENESEVELLPCHATEENRPKKEERKESDTIKSGWTGKVKIINKTSDTISSKPPLSPLACGAGTKVPVMDDSTGHLNLHAPPSSGRDACKALRTPRKRLAASPPCSSRMIAVLKRIV